MGDSMFFNSRFSQERAELNALSRSQAIIYFQPDGIIIDANDNFLNVMGYSLNDIKGQHHRIFVEPQYAQTPDYREFWEKLGRGEFQARQFKRLGNGNKEVWIEASYNPILDTHGKVFRVVKYAADITQQKLRNADYEGQFSAIGKSQAVIQFNMDGLIITANENFLQVMGYSLEEVQGRHHSIFADSDYAQGHEYKAFWQKLNRGEFVAGEFQRFGKDGKEVWIQASYNPIFDMNGKLFKVVKYASDITAEKLKNADFAGQLSAISKSQAVIEFQLDGTIITANENFLDALGYTLDEVRGQHHRMFVDPSEAQSVEYQLFWQKLGRGEFDARVYKRIAKGGREIWIQASYNPIFDMSGKPFKVVKYATDVTQVIQTGSIAEEATENVQSVAAAIEELTVSIEEISQNMVMSQEATAGILNDATQSSTAADHLTGSVQSMGRIAELINNIAGQVNLLALNATIEAARAGAAGKGFAVVASEVKNLATQTTKATEDIAKQIQYVQDIASSVADSIKNISASAGNVNEYVTQVAGAIEEQSAVTRDISSNTQQMADSVRDIAQRVKRLSAV